MNASRAASWALLLTLIALSEARALVLCTTPDGKTYAGDAPPADCKTKQTFDSPPPAPSAYDPKGVDPGSSDAGRIRAVNLCKKASHQEGDPIGVRSLGGWSFVVSWGDVECRADYTGSDEWSVRVTSATAQKAQRAGQAKAGAKALCLQSADDMYRREWANECAARGLDANCRLPTSNAQIIDNRREFAKRDCKD